MVILVVPTFWIKKKPRNSLLDWSLWLTEMITKIVFFITSDIFGLSVLMTRRKKKQKI